MSFKGLDPDALERFAVHLNNAAHSLRTSNSHVSGHLGSLAWLGAFADRFRGDWNGVYRLQMVAAAEHLESLASQIRAELRQQNQASASLGSTMSSGQGEQVPPSVERSFDYRHSPWRSVRVPWWLSGKGEPVRRHLEEFATLVGVGAVFTHRANTIGRYTNTWRSVMKLAHNDPILRFKSSTALQHLSRSPALKAAGAVEKFPPFAVLSAGLDAARFWDHGWKIGSDISHHHTGDAIGDGIDTVGDGLRTVGVARKSPVLYLTGVNISLWHEVGKAAYAFGNTFDPKQGIPLPFGKDGPAIYKQTASDVGHQLTEIFGRVF